MSLTAGTRLGAYEITAKLGEGGMGEVYRATDTKLRREVAIKVLPAAFTEDRERLARFEREAQLLAQLHHPHIASIFGMEESGGIKALVMELVEGPTLAERLEQGSLTLNESLLVARQIAEALEEAHEKGIIHRDLKPQNIKASIEGKVKVLDFGLAKAMDPAGTASGAPSASQLAASPTLTLGATVQGVILGTAAYMAPEQAAGGVADRRADIWSFGVVLYEMLSGRRLFEGETVSHVLAGVLKDEPDFSALPAQVPPKIRRLVQRCLRKKPRERLQAIGDARIVIDEVLAGANDEAPVRTPATEAAAPQPVWRRALPLVAALGVGALGMLAINGSRSAPASAPRTVADISLPPGTELGRGGPVISPDGTRLAVSLADLESRKTALWIRTIANGDWRRVPGTDGSRQPFWSPDGRSLGFLSDSRDLERVDLDGGRPVALAKTTSTCGATWGAEFIVFCPAWMEPLQRIRPTGGTPEATTSAPPADEYWVAPRMLPDGRSFLFLAYKRGSGSSLGQSRLLLGSTDGSAPREVVTSDSIGVVDGDRLFHLRGQTLLARTLGIGRDRVSVGDPTIVTDGVLDDSSGMFSSAAGLLVFAPSSLLQNSGSRISIYDRAGKRIDAIDSETFLDDLVVSRDGLQAAVMKASSSEGNDRTSDVWTVDLTRKLFSRATRGGGDDDPVFSPDGREIAFARGGDLYRAPVDGTGEPKLVAKKILDIVTQEWTPDGWIVYTDLENNGEDLYAIRADGGEPKRLTRTPFDERTPQVSPDGHWLAYAANDDGNWQVYLCHWPEMTGRWRLSTVSGAAPQWLHGGREVVYLSSDSKLMRVGLDLGGATPKIGLAEEMFAVDPSSGFSARKERWAASPDGDRFYVLESKSEKGVTADRLVLMTNPLAGVSGKR